MKIGGFFITLVVALVLTLAACSGDPQPREPDATTAPTPSSTATAPAMPTQASEDSPEGAAAFVKYWVDVSNYAAATGDVTELSRISSPDCSGCQKYIDLYRDTYKAGGYFKGGEWEVSDFSVRPTNAETFLTTRMTAPASTYSESADDPDLRDPGQSTTLSFAAAFNRSWSVTQLGLGEVK